MKRIEKKLVRYFEKSFSSYRHFAILLLILTAALSIPLGYSILSQQGQTDVPPAPVILPPLHEGDLIVETAAEQFVPGYQFNNTTNTTYICSTNTNDKNIYRVVSSGAYPIVATCPTYNGQTSNCKQSAAGAQCVYSSTSSGAGCTQHSQCGTNEFCLDSFQSGLDNYCFGGKGGTGAECRGYDGLGINSLCISNSCVNGKCAASSTGGGTACGFAWDSNGNPVNSTPDGGKICGNSDDPNNNTKYYYTCNNGEWSGPGAECNGTGGGGQTTCGTWCTNQGYFCVSNTTAGGTSCCPNSGHTHACGGTCYGGSVGSCGGTGGGTIPIPTNLTVSYIGNQTCSDVPYNVFLSWTNSGTGWYINISEDPNFTGWSQKPLNNNATSTSAPSEFNLNLSLEPDKTYYWRVWNTQQHSETANFHLPSCASLSPTGSPTATSAPDPSATATPIPPTASPTPVGVTPGITTNPTATTVPNPTATTAPGNPTSPPQPTATNTPAPNATILAFNVRITGVGSNTAVGQNPNPIRPNQPIEVAVFNAQNQQVKTASGALNYNPNTQTFQGTVSLDAFSGGAYTIKARFDNTLWRAQTAQIASGTTTTLAQAQYVSGDIDKNNILDLRDYNALNSCYGGRGCSNPERADLNIDGTVDEKDLNILLDGFATRQGD